MAETIVPYVPRTVERVPGPPRFDRTPNNTLQKGEVCGEKAKKHENPPLLEVKAKIEWKVVAETANANAAAYPRRNIVVRRLLVFVVLIKSCPLLVVGRFVLVCFLITTLFLY